MNPENVFIDAMHALTSTFTELSHYLYYWLYDLSYKQQFYANVQYQTDWSDFFKNV